MIKNIQIINHLGDWLTLDLRSPEKSGFFVRNVDGFGPSKADINTTNVLAIDGSVYNSANVGSRNIILSLGFLNNPTIEDTRRNSYKYFPIKKRIDILVETDKRIYSTYGYIESNIPNIFSRQEGCIISIVCPEAYLYSTNIVSTSITHFIPNFKFPFSNESLVSKLIEMGYGTWRGSENKNVYYDGDVEIGILITVYALGISPITNFEIYNIRTLATISIDSALLTTLTGEDFHGGDIITISTVKGNKYAILNRSGTIYNIINCLGKYPDWLTLQRGDNLFDYSADSGVGNAQVLIQNKIAYEGV